MSYDSFLEVLDVIKDPKKYEALVKELKAREDGIKEAIQSLNIVGDIDTAKKKAEALVITAEQKLKEADEKAAVIVLNAQAVFDKRNAELREKETAYETAISESKNLRAQWNADSANRSFLDKQLTAKEARIDEREKELRMKTIEVDERLLKLRQAMG